MSSLDRSLISLCATLVQACDPTRGLALPCTYVELLLYLRVVKLTRTNIIYASVCDKLMVPRIGTDTSATVHRRFGCSGDEPFSEHSGSQKVRRKNATKKSFVCMSLPFRMRSAACICALISTIEALFPKARCDEATFLSTILPFSHAQTRANTTIHGLGQHEVLVSRETVPGLTRTNDIYRMLQVRYICYVRDRCLVRIRTYERHADV